VSKGIGTTQKSILAALAETDSAWTINDLADRLGRLRSQICAAVNSLEKRELVVVEREYYDDDSDLSYIRPWAVKSVRVWLKVSRDKHAAEHLASMQANLRELGFVSMLPPASASILTEEL
jgi:predicted transcriptional regulator